jgi:hypothetical protein
MTIKKLDVPYRVDANFSVNGEAILTVEPGTEFRFFNTDSGINVATNAAIVMDGTAEQHILLRGYNTNPGSWGDVEIHSLSGENKLNYVDIVNGGSGTSNYSAALYLYSGSVSFTNSTITGSLSNGATTYGTGFFTAFSGNTISGSGKAPIYTESTIYSLQNLGSGNILAGTEGNPNTSNYIHVSTSASITGNMTLKKLDVPYYLQEGLNISDSGGTGRILTIEPGIEILMGGDKGIDVAINSKLIAVGNTANHIVIRGSQDQAGWWNTMVIHSEVQGTKFAYCDISGGGRGDSWSENSCLFLYDDAYVELDTVSFSKSNHYYVGFDDEVDCHIKHTGVTFDPPVTGAFINNVWYEGGQVEGSATLPASQNF